MVIWEQIDWMCAICMAPISESSEECCTLINGTLYCSSCCKKTKITRPRPAEPIAEPKQDLKELFG